MYWRRASFKTAKRSQAPGDATVLKRFFRDNFVIFRRRSQWSRDHISAPFSGLYLPQTLQTSKRHTFRVSAFYRYHWFWSNCFMYAVRRTVEGTLKREKCCLWIWLRPHYKIPEIFTIAPVLTSTLTVCRRNRGDPSSSYGALQVAYYKNIISHSGLAWSRPRADRGLSRPTSVFRIQ